MNPSTLPRASQRGGRAVGERQHIAVRQRRGAAPELEPAGRRHRHCGGRGRDAERGPHPEELADVRASPRDVQRALRAERGHVAGGGRERHPPRLGAVNAKLAVVDVDDAEDGGVLGPADVTVDRDRSAGVDRDGFAVQEPQDRGVVVVDGGGDGLVCHNLSLIVIFSYKYS